MRGDQGKFAHRLEYLNPVSFAGFLPLPLVGYSVSLIFTASLRSSKNGSLAITLPRTFFIILFPTAFYRRSRMTGRYLLPFCKKTLLPFYSRLPLSSAPLTLSPTSGDSFQFVFFLLYTDLAVNIFMKKLRILLPLVVRFPRTRREVPSLRGDRGMLVYTGQNRFFSVLLTLAPFDGYFCVSHFLIFHFHS